MEVVALKAKLETIVKSLGTDHNDPRSDFDLTLNLTVSIKEPHATTEEIALLYGTYLPKLIRIALRRKYADNDLHVLAARDFLEKMAALMAIMFEEELNGVLIDILNPTQPFYAKHGFPKFAPIADIIETTAVTSPLASGGIGEEWVATLELHNYIDVVPEHSTVWEIATIERFSSTKTEVEVLLLNGCKEWVSLENADRVAPFATRSAASETPPLLQGPTVAVAPAAFEVLDEPAIDPSYETWKKELVVGTLIDARCSKVHNIWLQACIMHIHTKEELSKPDVAPDEAVDAPMGGQDPEDVGESHRESNSSSSREDGTISGLKRGIDSIIGDPDGASSMSAAVAVEECPLADGTSVMMAEVKETVNDGDRCLTDNEDIGSDAATTISDSSLLMEDTQATLAVDIPASSEPRHHRCALVAFLGYAERFDEWIDITSIHDDPLFIMQPSSNGTHRTTAPLNTQSEGRYGDQLPIRSEIYHIMKCPSVPQDTTAVITARPGIIISPFFISVVQSFAINHGFNKILDKCKEFLDQRKDKPSDAVPNTTTPVKASYCFHLLSSLGRIPDVLSRGYLSRWSMEFLFPTVSTIFAHWSLQDIRDVSMESIESVLGVMDSFAQSLCRGNYSSDVNANVYRMVEPTWLVASYKCLNTPYLNKRLGGIKLLVDLLKRAQDATVCPNGLKTSMSFKKETTSTTATTTGSDAAVSTSTTVEANKELDHPDMAFKVIPVTYYFRSLSSLCENLGAFRAVLFGMFDGEQAHDSLITRCKAILCALASTDKLEELFLDTIWNVGYAQHNAAALQLLCEVVPNMSLVMVETFYSRHICFVKIENLSKCVVDCVFAVSRRCMLEVVKLQGDSDVNQAFNCHMQCLSTLWSWSCWKEHDYFTTGAGAKSADDVCTLARSKIEEELCMNKGITANLSRQINWQIHWNRCQIVTQWAINALGSSTNVISSLKLLKCVMFSWPIDMSSPEGCAAMHVPFQTRSEVAVKLQQDYHLIDVVVDYLVTLKVSLNKACSNSSIGDRKVSASEYSVLISNEKEQALVNGLISKGQSMSDKRSGYCEVLADALDFIVHFARNTQTLEIQQSHVEKIWSTIMVNSILPDEASSVLHFCWSLAIRKGPNFPHKKSDGKNARDSLCQESTINYIFRELLCSPSFIKSSQFAMDALTAVQRLFLWVNLKAGKVTEGKSLVSFVIGCDPTQLVGLHVFFDIALYCDQELVSASATQYLSGLPQHVSLTTADHHTEGSSTATANSSQSHNSDFRLMCLDKYMKEMKALQVQLHRVVPLPPEPTTTTTACAPRQDSVDKGVTRVLRMLNALVEESSQNTTCSLHAHNRFHRGAALQVRINCSTKLIAHFTGTLFTVHSNDTVDELADIIAKAIGFSRSDIKLFCKGKELYSSAGEPVSMNLSQVFQLNSQGAAISAAANSAKDAAAVHTEVLMVNLKPSVASAATLAPPTATASTAVVSDETNVQVTPPQEESCLYSREHISNLCKLPAVAIACTDDYMDMLFDLLSYSHADSCNNIWNLLMSLPTSPMYFQRWLSLDNLSCVATQWTRQAETTAVNHAEILYNFQLVDMLLSCEDEGKNSSSDWSLFFSQHTLLLCCAEYLKTPMDEKIGEADASVNIDYNEKWQANAQVLSLWRSKWQSNDFGLGVLSTSLPWLINLVTDFTAGPSGGVTMPCVSSSMVFQSLVLVVQVLLREYMMLCSKDISSEYLQLCLSSSKLASIASIHPGNVTSECSLKVTSLDQLYAECMVLIPLIVNHLVISPQTSCLFSSEMLKSSVVNLPIYYIEYVIQDRFQQLLTSLNNVFTLWMASVSVNPSVLIDNNEKIISFLKAILLDENNSEGSMMNRGLLRTIQQWGVSMLGDVIKIGTLLTKAPTVCEPKGGFRSQIMSALLLLRPECTATSTWTKKDISCDSNSLFFDFLSALFLPDVAPSSDVASDNEKNATPVDLNSILVMDDVVGDENCSPVVGLRDIAHTTDHFSIHLTLYRRIVSELIAAFVLMDGTKEITESLEVVNLSGNLLLLSSLVQRISADPSHPKISELAEVDVLDVIISKVLGLRACLSASANARVNMQCLAPDTIDDSTYKSRQYAYQVLEALSSNDTSHFGVQILEQFNDVHNATKKPNSSDYKPENEARVHAGYTGLRNFGCTCYMNSLLQMLFMNTRFREGILKSIVLPPESSDSTPSIPVTEEQTKEYYNNHLVYQLQKMFLHLEHGNQRAFLPTDWVYAYKDETNVVPIDVKQQQDAQEFFQVLCERLDKLMSPVASTAAPTTGNEGKSLTLTQRTMGGQLCNRMEIEDDIDRSDQWNANENVREQEEDFVCISLDVKGSTNLETSLQKFVTGERIGDFQWKEGFPRVNILKTQCISNVADSVIFHLKRFELNFDTFLREKVNDSFPFPFELDLYPYTREGLFQRDSGNSAADQFMFELSGIIVHTGSSDSGHYYSILKEPAIAGKSRSWVEFNDSFVSEFKEANISTDCFGGTCCFNDMFMGSGDIVSTEKPNPKSAYMLIYTRVKVGEAAAGPADGTLTAQQPAQEDQLATSLSSKYSLHQLRQHIFAENDQFTLQLRVLCRPHAGYLKYLLYKLTDNAQVVSMQGSVPALLYSSGISNATLCQTIIHYLKVLLFLLVPSVHKDVCGDIGRRICQSFEMEAHRLNLYRQEIDQLTQSSVSQRVQDDAIQIGQTHPSNTIKEGIMASWNEVYRSVAFVTKKVMPGGEPHATALVAADTVTATDGTGATEVDASSMHCMHNCQSDGCLSTHSICLLLLSLEEVTSAMFSFDSKSRHMVSDLCFHMFALACSHDVHYSSFGLLSLRGPHSVTDAIASMDTFTSAPDSIGSIGVASPSDAGPAEGKPPAALPTVFENVVIDVEDYDDEDLAAAIQLSVSGQVTTHDTHTTAAPSHKDEHDPAGEADSKLVTVEAVADAKGAVKGFDERLSAVVATASQQESEQLSLSAKMLLEMTRDSRLRTVAEQWRRSDAFVQFIHKVAHCGHEARLFLIQRQVIAQWVDIFLGDQSGACGELYPTNCRKRMPSSYTAAIAPPQKPIETVVDGVVTFTPTLPFAWKNLPDCSLLLETVSLLTCMCNNKISASGSGLYRSDDTRPKLDHWSFEFVTRKTLYATSLRQYRYTNAIINMMVHMCEENVTFTTSISEVIFENISMTTFDASAHLFKALNAFMCVGDSLVMNRINLVFGGQLNMMDMLKERATQQAQQQYVCVCCRSVLTIANHVPGLFAFLKSKIRAWAGWMLKFCFQYRAKLENVDKSKSLVFDFIGPGAPQSAQVMGATAAGEEVPTPVVKGPYVIVYGEDETEAESTWRQRAEATYNLLEASIRAMGGNINDLIPIDSFEELPSPPPFEPQGSGGSDAMTDEQLAEFLSQQSSDMDMLPGNYI